MQRKTYGLLLEGIMYHNFFFNLNSVFLFRNISLISGSKSFAVNIMGGVILILRSRLGSVALVAEKTEYYFNE